MNRTARDKNQFRPRPVQRLELDETVSRKKLWIFAIAFAVAIAAFWYGFTQLTKQSSGWREIETKRVKDEISCSADFVFYYDLGRGDLSATEEYKRIADLYTECALHAYKAFSANEEFEGIHNLWYLNRHPNETVEVDWLLYGALEKAVAGGRYLYLAPVYTQYHTLFNCGDISETVNYDPFVNPEIAAYFSEICSYINDESAISIQLLGGGKVRLNVSDAYLAYCVSEGIDTFADFYWMRNAFIIDYFAESLQEAGFIHGYISSYDGFIRNLDEGGPQEFTLNVYGQVDDLTYTAASFAYQGGRNFVYLRDYQIDAAHDRSYFNMGDGEFRTAYIDPADGLCKSSADSLILYSDTQGCADMLLCALPDYISDGTMTGPVDAPEVFSLWTVGNKIFHSDPKITFSEIYAYEEKGVRFEAVLTGPI